MAKPEVQYHFEWDAAKAASNRRKHGISFELAATVFRDPLMLSMFDDEHSEQEERWVTLGKAANQVLVVVVHTWRDEAANAVRIRLISARPATAAERQQYEG
ncbi:BrnT family toxin [Permianibacter aggregans]|uniref:Uncharacterized protein n=1 Tax=Permianibacter aggregans TaxID=1510150 RepID=A0A4R6UWL5_9GAMM|nr:BrnT family toxin [Permianibacter aggregans]QGX39334.1 BrnT family toxin [Permianibacter aggregans]QGX39342.1 BrnT family toxin [Permianibacter aggregans]TDQ49925.1 hypothetical protein EV696_103300 [Permianibacter aggregans]